MAYPSSVLMNVIPAQVAGVSEIAVASPPQAEFGGLPHPAILAACALLGVSEVHAAGGAQAIAMFGYGTADCAPVDVITGPGNVYVAAAKRLLRERVAIDAEAGVLDYLDRLTAVDLLHIDDLGAEKTTEWVLEQLYSIVNARYEAQRAIVATTNLMPEKLAEQIG